MSDSPPGKLPGQHAAGAQDDVETGLDRAESVSLVLNAAAGESSSVKEAALSALVPAPGRTAADVVWVVLVGGLIVILVLAILGLTHVLGRTVSDDKLVTVFTTVLAGLLGLFARAPGGKD